MNALFLLQGIGMIVVGLVAILYWKHYSRVSVFFFLWGGISWFVSMALKSAAASPMPHIITRLRDAAPAFISEPLLWLFVGMLTGVFECSVAVAFVYWQRRIRSARWKEALGYGLGFGATEAIFLGTVSFVIVLLFITIPDQLPPELVALLNTGNASLLAIPVPIVERAITILLHAFSSILIIYAVQKREWKWFWASFIYKTAMDTIAGYFQITYGTQNLTLGGAWLVELAIVPFGIVGLWGLIAFRNRWLSTREDSVRSIQQGQQAQQPVGSLEILSGTTGDE